MHMLVKFLWTSAITSVENGLGDSLTVNPGEIIEVDPDTRLREKYPSSFELVKYGVDRRAKKVTLTAAQIKALYTTPQALVAAPWAWYFIDVASISASLDYGSAAYATYTNLEFRYTDGSGTKVASDISNLLTATADKLVTIPGRQSAVLADLTAIRAPLAWMLSGSATYDTASLADWEGVTTTVTVTWAAVGDFVLVSIGVDVAGITVTGYVSAADTVSVRIQNESWGTLDLASTTIRARVLPQASFTAPAALTATSALVNTANAAVVVCAPSGNPATWDSPISFIVTYRVLPV